MHSDHAARAEHTIRVLVADSTLIHTRLLADALKRDPGFDVIPFESDSSSLVAAAAAQSVDVLVVSSNLDSHFGRGLEILRQQHSARNRARAILLLESSKDDAPLQAFRAGAKGVLGKNEPVEVLIKCIRCVHQGQIWANSQDLGVAIDALASSSITRALTPERAGLLSQREQEVVRSLAEGLSNREIAQRLDLSPHTVKNYLFRIFEKLGASSRLELLSMTLGYATPEHKLAPSHQSHTKEEDGSGEEFDLLSKGAQSGLPAAQLGLAKWYLSHHHDPRDLVQAYMWYLIASKSIARDRARFKKMLTPAQEQEALQQAILWLAKFEREGGT